MRLSDDFRKTLWAAVKILMAIGLIALVFSRTNFADLSALSKKISLAWISISFLIFILMTLLKTLEYWVLLERPTRYARLLDIVVWQNAISNFVANAAGIASYLTMLRLDENVRIRRSTAAFIIAKLGDLVAVAVTLAVSTAFVWPRIGAIRNIIPPITAVIFLGVFLFIAMLSSKPLIGFMLNRLHSLPILLKLPGLASLIDILNILEQQEKARLLGLIGRGIFLSGLYFLLTAAWLLTLLKGLAFPLDFWPVIFVITLGQIVSIIPIQVLGGLGVYEATNLYFYALFGIAQTQGATTLVGMRLIFYAMNALILLYFPLRWLFNKFRPTQTADE